MYEQKTKPSEQSVDAFLGSIPDEKQRRDAFAIRDLMQQITGLEPKLWGGTMVGFGSYHYRYASGHEGDSFVTGFAPRKKNLSLYIMPGFERFGDLMSKLGKHTTGKSCLYINTLDDVDLPTLRELVKQSFQVMGEMATPPGA